MITNRPEYIVTYFAILANVAIVVPINPTFKEKEVEYILNDSECIMLITEQLTKPVVENILDPVLDYVSFIDDIPKSGTGKLLKTALKELDKNMLAK